MPAEPDHTLHEKGRTVRDLPVTEAEVARREDSFKYDTHIAPHLNLVAKMVMKGETDEKIANRLGVAPDQLQTSRVLHPELDDLLDRPVDTMDTMVQNALLRKAVGHEVLEVKEVRDASGTVIRTEVVRREVPPDYQAQLFWLKNRKPDEWKDSKQIEQTIETTNTNIEQVQFYLPERERDKPAPSIDITPDSVEDMPELQ